MNPSKPFNSVLFRKYISSLTKLAEEYLFVSRVSEDKYRKRLTMLEIYQRAGLNNLYNKKESEISGDVNAMNRINSSYFQNKMLHSEIRFNRLNKHTNDDNSLSEIIEYQLYLYLNFIQSYSNNLGKLFVYNYNFKIAEDDDIFKKYFGIVDKKFFEEADNLFTGEDLKVYRQIKNDAKIYSGHADGVSISKMRDNIFECRDLQSHNMQYDFIARHNNFCLLMNSKGILGY